METKVQIRQQEIPRVHPGQTVTYAIPSLNGSIRPETIYLEGKWKIDHDNAELQSDFGRIGLLCSAKSVNLIAGVKVKR